MASKDAPARDRLRAAAKAVDGVRTDARKLIAEALPGTETRDTDHVFLSFVIAHMPIGLVGLLIAVILCAAMSAVSSGLISLGATTTSDFYLRARTALGRPRATPAHELRASKAATIGWGFAVLFFASVASLFENLIQAVNILGSLFYGTILGLFVVALFLRRVTATPVLVGAILAEASVVALFFFTDLGFLWFNVIGCAIVVVVSLLVQLVLPSQRKQEE